MGFFERLIGRQYKPASTTPERGRDYYERDGTRKLSVVGESHYQAALIRVSGAPAEGEHQCDCIAVLVREPTNRHDPKAVMVQVDSECVGYLSRHNAARFGPKVEAMEANGEPCCCAAWIGRADDGNPNLGISLRIDYDGALLS